MTLVQTKDPSEFWMCLRLPKYERRHKHFVGKERTREYSVKKPVLSVVEPEVREYAPEPLPALPQKKIVKAFDPEFIGPPDMSMREGEYKLAWARRWIAHNHGVTVQELEGLKRTRKFVAARQEYFYYAHIELGFSLPQISHTCSDRDHTTVLHGVRKHAKDTGKTMRPDIQSQLRDDKGNFCLNPT